MFCIAIRLCGWGNHRDQRLDALNSESSFHLVAWRGHALGLRRPDHFVPGRDDGLRVFPAFGTEPGGWLFLVFVVVLGCALFF